jgi:mannose-1-phosphate guanylyltransferase/mannose-1-phosphate guanylyltransferase/mannose-6-phosphate isomerase
MTETGRQLVPVILCGGAGTRLWPMSRDDLPKQFLPLAGPWSLLQSTLLRFGDATRYRRPVVVAGETQRFLVAEQVRQIESKATVVLEPLARGTAPAIAAVALILAESDAETLMLVLPSDHVIGDEATFHAKIDAAIGAAVDGRLVTFSIVPTRPETGYGYIRHGDGLAGHEGVFAVSEFVEKPDAQRAQEFLAGGRYFWNSGMFLFSAATLVAELERFAPDIVAAARRAVAASATDPDFTRLDAESFAAAPSLSIDKALMEKTPHAVTLPCAIGWSDVGSWAELWTIGTKDANGNVVVGEVIADDARDCYLRGDEALVAAVGVQDLVVVATAGAVLVTSRQRSQDVRTIAERLRGRG